MMPLMKARIEGHQVSRLCRSTTGREWSWRSTIPTTSGNHRSHHQRATLFHSSSTGSRMTRKSSTRCINSQTNLYVGSARKMTIPLHKQTCRSYMDVHTRPSHSRMFDRPGNAWPPPPPPPPVPPPHQDPSPPFLFYTSLISRTAFAVGIVYVITEYVADITLCEGPSMVPTIHPHGEIVLIQKGWTIPYARIDKNTHNNTIWSGQERIRQAQERQTKHEKETKSDTWHEEFTSVLSRDGKSSSGRSVSWKLAYRHLRSPLTVGDVVVVQHPNRKGTVCKRIVGMPGDQVVLSSGVLQQHPTKPFSSRSGRDIVSGSTQLLVVPDGHVWLEGDNALQSSDSRTYGVVPAALIVGRVIARIWPLRGNAWMERGRRPTDTQASTTVVKGRDGIMMMVAGATASGGAGGCTVLPAGYEGQEIVILGRKKDDKEYRGGEKGETIGPKEQR